MASHSLRSTGSALPALALCAALSAGLACLVPPEPAFALDDASPLAVAPATLAPVSLVPAVLAADEEEPAAGLEQVRALAAERAAQQAAQQAAERQDKRLAYDPALIAAIGNQSAGGHTICCPAYACAYGDAVLTGQANDHGSYGCGCCTWPGWGGGNSSFRSLGSDEALLREAYDEIAAGRPTVVHVAGPYGEHWICLMGYQNIEDPDALTLDNFIALDPSNGQEVVASYRYVPYGDACEHVTDQR